ncbi:MAG: toll/interleukin-1 receptor domain-containing protein [Candidatus Zixiibacteriota bacterium]
MAYKVFLSHSSKDQGLVMALARLLSKYEIEVFVAEWYLAPGVRLSKKVLTQIEKSDCVIALLTRDGVRSNWVHQEIGYSIQHGKPVIPLVEKGIDRRELAALEEKEYIEFDPHQPQQALLKLSTYVKSLKLKREQRDRIAPVVGGLLAFFLLLSAEKE